MFHSIEPPEEVLDLETVVQLGKLIRLKNAWDSRREDPTREMIDELKTFLIKIDETGWTARPSGAYADELEIISGGETPGLQGPMMGV